MKRRRSDIDRDYLEWIRDQPCILCPVPPLAMSEAAHAGIRGLGQKAPDRTAIPLCSVHHRTGKEAYHVLGKKFWTHHGIERDATIAGLNERYDAA